MNEIAKLALRAAALACPFVAEWLRRSAMSAPTNAADVRVSSIVLELLPEESESAEAARVLRDG